MKYRILLICFVLSTIFYSCEKGDNIINTDPNYPTTFYKLDSALLTQARTNYSQQNQYLKTSLSKFGFCDGFADRRTPELPPFLDIQTQSEAAEVVNIFFSQNSIYTGVKNPDELNYSKIYSRSIADGSSYWTITISEQRIDSIEVLGTRFTVRIKNGEMYYCHGNWYPDIYIPKKFNLNQDLAKFQLLYRVVTQWGYGGSNPHDVIISLEDLNQSTFKLFINAIEYVDRIELRLIWEITVPAVGRRFHVDVMTGEILMEVGTFYS